MNKKYHALSVLNQIIPYLADQLADMFPENFCVTSGQDTYLFHENHGIPKDHYLDAYSIACSALTDANKVSVPKGRPYMVRQFRRHDRQACHKANLNRSYYMGGKLVATNRHKAMEQKMDSLEEYRAAHSAADISKLTVKHLPAQYKDISRVMPGSILVSGEGKLFTLARSEGRHGGIPDYFVSTEGAKYGTRKCQYLRNNGGLQIYV